MNWKMAHRSIYFEAAEEPEDIKRTAVLVIDIQNTYLEDKDTLEETARWRPFFRRMQETVIPNTAKLISDARARGA